MPATFPLCCQVLKGPSVGTIPYTTLHPTVQYGYQSQSHVDMLIGFIISVSKPIPQVYFCF